MDTPESTDGGHKPAVAKARRRNADETRLALLAAARRHFAVKGFEATKVLSIAGDAGVNVALINRYFGSKEGLFVACVQSSVNAIAPTSSPEAGTADELITRLLTHVLSERNSEVSLHLLLLLRSSGELEADRIRRMIVGSFTDRMVDVVAPEAGDSDDETVALRAQIAIATMLGLFLMRTYSEVEPLTSATVEQIERPLRVALSALFAIEPLDETTD